MKPEQPGYAVLPDMYDTTLLVDLTSHGSDLSEASHALAQALEAGEESPLWVPLTSHAVTAYIRRFILSKVRERLDEMAGIPAMPARIKEEQQSRFSNLGGFVRPKFKKGFDQRFRAAPQPVNAQELLLIIRAQDQLWESMYSTAYSTSLAEYSG